MKNKVKPDKAEVLKLIELINNPDISSEARLTAISMLEQLTGREISTKKDVLKMAKEYEED